MSEPRVFEHFPIGKECPVCGTNKDGWSALVPIDGTTEGGICEAIPVHTACLSDLSRFRYNREFGFFYIAEKK